MKVISVTPSGALKGLHFDDFDLGQFGKKQVERASEIFWDDMNQTWNVLLPDQSIPFLSASGFASYEIARDFEVAWLQECALQGIKAGSNRGEDIAGEVKQRLHNER